MLCKFNVLQLLHPHNTIHGTLAFTSNGTYGPMLTNFLAGTGILRGITSHFLSLV